MIDVFVILSCWVSLSFSHLLSLGRLGREGLGLSLSLSFLPEVRGRGLSPSLSFRRLGGEGLVDFDAAAYFAYFAFVVFSFFFGLLLHLGFGVGIS